MSRRDKTHGRKNVALKEWLQNLFRNVSDDDVLAIDHITRTPGISQVVAELQAILASLDQKQQDVNETEAVKVFLPLITDMITGVWRSQQKMLTPGSTEPTQEFRRAYRPLLSISDRWLQAGFEVKDRTNQPYDIGLLEKVVAYQPTPGLIRETIIETLKPSIFYCGRMVQQGEVIVGTVDQNR